jgi:hypothetical protein
MDTAKEHILKIMRRQPDGSSYDDIMRELAFDLMVQRGLRDSDEQRVISNEEMQHRIKDLAGINGTHESYPMFVSFTPGFSPVIKEGD